MNAFAASVERRRVAGYVVATLEVRQVGSLVTGTLSVYGADGCSRAALVLYPCATVEALAEVAERAAAETWRLALGSVTDTQDLGSCVLYYYRLSPSLTPLYPLHLPTSRPTYLARRAPRGHHHADQHSNRTAP